MNTVTQAGCTQLYGPLALSLSLQLRVGSSNQLVLLSFVPGRWILALFGSFLACQEKGYSATCTANGNQNTFN